MRRRSAALALGCFMAGGVSCGGGGDGGKPASTSADAATPGDDAGGTGPRRGGSPAGPGDDGSAGNPVDAPGAMPDAAAGPDAAASPPDVGADAAVNALAEACADFGKRLCDRLEVCGPLFVRIQFGGPVVCAERMRLDCLLEGNAPGSAVRAAEVSRCARDFSTIQCIDLLKNNSLDSCFPPGPRPVGQPCYAQSQCQSSLCALNDTGCGRCVPRVPEGGSCLTDAQCEKDLTCPAATHVCTRPATLGHACNDKGQPCQATLVCRLGTCQVAKGPGADCSGDNECDFGQLLFCQKSGLALVGKCQTFKLPGPGEACGQARNALPFCQASTCDANSGRCIPFADDSAPCGAAANGRACMAPGVCVAGTCEAPACK
jgi:hypothetical protein